MKPSERCTGLAMFIILLVAMLADSPNIRLWTALAVLGVIGAGALIRWAMAFERRGK